MSVSELRIENLRMTIEDFTLAAHFRVAKGERAALIGRSGMGKSTLLRAIAGLESLDAGRIFIDGQDVTEAAPQSRDVGFVFQDAALFPALTVLENAVFGLRQHGVSRDDSVDQGMEWLERVGLASKAESSIAHLSGGEAQRVAFVRALIWKPRVLLLDEPFSALDSELRQELRRELLSLHQQWPVPMLLVSHDAHDLEQVANVRLELRAVNGPSVREVVRI